MKKSDYILKKISIISSIVFSISLVLFSILILPIVLGNTMINLMPIFIINSILLSITVVSISVCSIILIIKICMMNDVKTGDKILWSLLLYLFNIFIIPFAMSKYIDRSENNKNAIKLVVFEVISIVVAIICYFVSFFYMVSLI